MQPTQLAQSVPTQPTTISTSGPAGMNFRRRPSWSQLMKQLPNPQPEHFIVVRRPIQWDGDQPLEVGAQMPPNAGKMRLRQLYEANRIDVEGSRNVGIQRMSQSDVQSEIQEAQSEVQSEVQSLPVVSAPVSIPVTTQNKNQGGNNSQQQRFQHQNQKRK